MARVSILMNAYNAEKYLKEAIDSIYAQSYSDWEIIFVDNCSTDRTKEIVDSYDDKIKYCKTQKNIPLGHARNFGLKYCDGEYLAFLDTDDIWLENKLALQIEMMDKQEIQLCYGGVITIDEKGVEIGRFLPQAKSGNVFPQQLKRYEINMQSVMLRNNIEIAFNETMQFSPDFDLFLIISSQYNVGVIDQYLVRYRKVENSLTNQKIERWWIETKDTLDRIFTLHPEYKMRYKKEYFLAYAKNNYYKAQYLVGIGKKEEARLALSSYKFASLKYFLLYISLFFSLSFWHFIHRFK